MVLLDFMYEHAIDPAVGLFGTDQAALEHEWKRARDPKAADRLELFYRLVGLPAGEQFERLKVEVRRDVHKDVLEELTSEQGNFEREPWAVQVLRDTPPYQPRRGESILPPDFRAPATLNWGGELWVEEDVTRFPVMDYAPEWLQQRLERQYGSSAEFVTTYTYSDEDDQYLRDPKTGAVYERVESNVLGERECPFATWDTEENTDAEVNVVKVTDTEFGEHPGQRCRYCEEEMHGEHGYLGPGYDVENVYVRLKPRIATTDTPEARDEVERQWLKAYGADWPRYELKFEQGGFRESTWTVYAYEDESDVDGTPRAERFRAEDDGEGGIDFI